MSPERARWLRLGLAAGVLGLIWGAWRPVMRTLPAELAQPQTSGELQRLPPGQAFILAGRVEPIDRREVPRWQGRVVYVHKQRRDLSGNAGGKTVRVVIVEDHRPAVRLSWSGEDWMLPAGSYSLDYAPRVEPHSWPRKWLWTTPVDDWDASSTGFRAGEEAIALGRVGAEGRPQITDLLEAPLEKTLQHIGAQNRARWGVVLAAKIVLTAFTLSWVVSRGKLR